MGDRYIVGGIASIASIVFMSIVIDFNSADNTFIIAIIPFMAFGFSMLIIGVDSPYSHEKRFPASLESIHDGDTVKLNFNGRIESYRIQYIDTPELDQSGGEASSAMMAVLLKLKYLEYSLPEKGNTKTYDRTICKLYANGNDVGLELIRRGYAWVDTRYPTPHEYIEAFSFAVKHKKGLFKKGFPLHPELHRERKKRMKTLKK